MKHPINGAFVWTILLGLFVMLLVTVAGGFTESLRFTPYLAGFGTLFMVIVLLAGSFYPEILRWTKTTLQDLWGGGGGESAAADTEEEPPWSAVLRSMGYAVLAALIASAILLTGMVLLHVEVWAGIIPEIIEGYLGGSIIPPL